MRVFFRADAAVRRGLDLHEACQGSVAITLRGKTVSLLRCPPSSPDRTFGYKGFAPCIGLL